MWWQWNRGINIGTFLIGCPIEALPDSATYYQSISNLHQWNLCQNVVRHFLTRWSTEYLASLRHFTKWTHRSRNLREGGIVVMQEDGMIPTRWPLGRIVTVYTGKDGVVWVVDVKTNRNLSSSHHQSGSPPWIWSELTPLCAYTCSMLYMTTM